MQKILALLAVLLSATLCSNEARAQKKPNIVLVFMDNFGWGELGCYGGGVLRGAPTPRIDKRCTNEGMRLLNFNVEAQCTPSRAAIMTGRYAIRTGNAEVPSGYVGAYGLDAVGVHRWRRCCRTRVTRPACSASGISATPKGRYPTDQGFDEWYGIPNSSDESYWPDNDLFRKDVHPQAKYEYVMEARRGENAARA